MGFNSLVVFFLSLSGGCSRPPPTSVALTQDTTSAAILAEKSGIGRTEDRDSHDRPITRDRNDRKCHLMYKH